MNKKQRSCDGRAASRLACNKPKKEGCAQDTGAHARPNTTSQILRMVGVYCAVPYTVSFLQPSLDSGIS